MKLTIPEIQAIGTEMLQEVTEICERNNIEYYLAYGSVLGAVRHGGPIPWDHDTDMYIPFPQLEFFLKTVREQLSPRFFVDFHDTNPKFNGLFPRVGLAGRKTTHLHLDVFFLSGVPDTPKEQKRFYYLALWLHKCYLHKRIRKKAITKKGKIKHLIYRTAMIPLSERFLFKTFMEISAGYPYEDSEYVFNPNGYYGPKEVFPKSYLGQGSIQTYAGFQVKIPEHYDDYLRHFYDDYMTPPPEEQRYRSHAFVIKPLD